MAFEIALELIDKDDRPALLYSIDQDDNKVVNKLEWENFYIKEETGGEKVV